MDYTTKLLLAMGALGLLLLLWLVWKFFASLLKHLLLALLLAAVGAGLYWHRLQPDRNPAIGKHAYLLESGKYLGVVEGDGEDKQRGEVWAVRPPGGYPKMYAKARVLLKEKFEAPASPEPAPSPQEPAKNKGKKGAADDK